jgi:quercetin dioxygenase-like cupin family protein
VETISQDAVRIGELELRFKISDENATVFEFVVPPNARVPAPHHHVGVDEILYGLEGILTVRVEGETSLLGPGDAVFIPRGCVHHHENLHEQVSRTLVVMTPGAIGRGYFDELADVINVSGKPDLATAREIMLRHGLVPSE